MKFLAALLISSIAFFVQAANFITITSVVYNAPDSSVVLNFTTTKTNGSTTTLNNLSNYEYSFDGGTTWVVLSPASTSPTTIAIPDANGYSSFTIRSVGSIPTTTSNTFTTAVPLPVTWAGFDVKATESGNRLEWKTASEVNTSHFEIEYSYDAINYQNTGDKVIAAGNSKELKTYNYNHIDFSNFIYYRINQIDIDKKSELSKVVYVKRDNAETFTVDVFPIPITNDNKINIRVQSIDKSLVTIKVRDFSGREIYQYSTIPENNFIQKEIDVKAWTTGIYHLEVSNGQGIERRKIVK